MHRGANTAERAARPSDAELEQRLQLTRALLDEGEIEAALAHLSVVQRAEPNWFSYRLLYARALLQGRADPLAAAEQAHACVELHRRVAECWVVLGDALRDLGEFAAAESSYAEAVAQGWSARDLQPARARVAFAAGEFDVAIAHASSALHHADDVPLRLVRARAHEALGNFDDAEADYQHIAAAHQDALRGLRYLAAFYERRGDPRAQERVESRIRRLADERLPERRLRPLR